MEWSRKRHNHHINFDLSRRLEHYWKIIFHWMWGGKKGYEMGLMCVFCLLWGISSPRWVFCILVLFGSIQLCSTKGKMKKTNKLKHFAKVNKTREGTFVTRPKWWKPMITSLVYSTNGPILWAHVLAEQEEQFAFINVLLLVHEVEGCLNASGKTRYFPCADLLWLCSTGEGTGWNHRGMEGENQFGEEMVQRDCRQKWIWWCMLQLSTHFYSLGQNPE